MSGYSSIKIGDMVQVIKPTPCCGHISRQYFGDTFTVTDIAEIPLLCTATQRSEIWRCALGHPNGAWCQIAMLKKVPPATTYVDSIEFNKQKEPA